jgi:hypothetical protein
MMNARGNRPAAASARIVWHRLQFKPDQQEALSHHLFAHLRV